MNLFNSENISDAGTQTNEPKDGYKEDINTNCTNNNKQDLSFSDMSSIDHKEDETLIDIQDIGESPSKKKRKLTKEDLETIPLPLFECMYCSNELITFQYLSRHILSLKYLLVTSIVDIQTVSALIKISPFSLQLKDFSSYSFDYESQKKISLMLMKYIITKTNRK